MKIKEIKEKVVEELKKISHLPPELIAYEIEKQGIQGRRADPCDCPIANYLTKLCGPRDASFPFLIRVGSNHINITTSAGFEGVSIPPKVERFVTEFDHGEWSFLDAELN